MSMILTFSLIILAIVALLIFIIRRVYTGSVISFIGIVMVILAGSVAMLAYILGTRGLINIIWALPVAIVVLASCMYYLKITLINPIGSMTADILDNLSLGKLNFTFEKELRDRKDEFGKIACALEDMKDKLHKIMEEVSEISGNILNSANQQNASAQQITEGANDQASSIEEVSSSVEQMKSNMEKNAEHAKKAEGISAVAAGEIGGLVSTTNKNVESVGLIASKIIIINDIAFQTNILALNAAVEAARAGEYGKGFSVVASEVRKLAERSKHAAEDINQLAASIVTLTQESAKKMQVMAPEIKNTSQMINEISVATSEQYIGAEQINNAVNQLNTVTQQNAVTAEELAFSSDELTTQAKRLVEVLEFFKK